MNNDYKKLYEAQDDLSNQLKKVVGLQKKRIEMLETENKELKQENQELKEEIQSLGQICEEQQGWVRKFLGE